MTPTEVGLLAAVLESPADDTPRLIYADWLEEHGGQPERAEFIRLQIEREAAVCELYGTPDDAPTLCRAACHRCAIRRRETELLAALHSDGVWNNRYVWVGGPGSAMDLSCVVSDLIWRRGFVDQITCTAADWLAAADNVLSAHPIREVALTTWPDAIVDRDCIKLPGRNRWYEYSRFVTDGVLAIGPVLGRRLLELEWRGITFHLPANQPAGTRLRGTNSGRAISVVDGSLGGPTLFGLPIVQARSRDGAGRLVRRGWVYGRGG